MYNPFKKNKNTSPTPQIISGWEKVYGKNLSVLNMDGKVGYVRQPTEIEVRNILLKITTGSRHFDETKYLKAVLELCWLGGDKSLIYNNKIIELNKIAWQTL